LADTTDKTRKLATGETEVSSLPLAVDLDRTLIRTDSLIEHFLSSLFRHPRTTFLALRSLREGKAVFKKTVMSIAAMDGRNFPFNEQLVEYLRREKSEGRELHLVTAADQSVADFVAAEAGIFDSAVGSNNGHNLRGRHKLDYLQRRFPLGFAYAGDSRADLAVWQGARSAVLVGVTASTRRAVQAMGCAVELEIPPLRASIWDWLKLIRIHQWSKNVLLFVPLILGQSYRDPAAVLSVVLGFIAFGLTASGNYIFNDISDIAADRAHATKRYRPIAKATISAELAFAVAVVLVAAGLLLMTAQSFAAGGLLLVYLLSSLSYSVALKRLAMVDVFVLGGLYTLRILIGGYLVGAESSHWLVLFSFFFFFSLSLAKRHVEIVNAAAKLPPEATIKGRGYRVGDAPLTLAFGVGACLVSVMILSLYIATDMYPRSLYAQPQFLWGTAILVMMRASRVWLLSHRGELNDDPVAFALKDPPSMLMGAAAAGVLLLAIA